MNNLDDFKKSFTQDKPAAIPGEKRIPSWLELVKPPKIICILGYIGMGKSALAYYLAEQAIKEYNLLGVTVNLPLVRQGLLPGDWVIKQLEDIESMDNSVVIIDEGTTKLPAGSKLEDMVKGFASLCRQRNQTIIFIFHSSRDVGSRILRGVGPLMMKWPSRRQIQFGSKDAWLRDILLKAKEKYDTIKELGGDVREYVFVDSEDPDFQGIMKNGTPSFWTEELSCAWAGESKGRNAGIDPSAGKLLNLEGGIMSILQNYEPPATLNKKYWDTYHDLPPEAEITPEAQEIKTTIEQYCADGKHYIAREADRYFIALVKAKVHDPIEFAEKIGIIKKT